VQCTCYWKILVFCCCLLKEFQLPLRTNKYLSSAISSFLVTPWVHLAGEKYKYVSKADTGETLKVDTGLQHQSDWIALLGKLQMEMLPFLLSATGNVP